MTGGVSLVSKFKVTNLVFMKDEELTVVHMDFSIHLTKTVQTPHGLLVLAPLFLFGNAIVSLGEDTVVVLHSLNGVKNQNSASAHVMTVSKLDLISLPLMHRMGFFLQFRHFPFPTTVYGLSLSAVAFTRGCS